MSPSRQHLWRHPEILVEATKLLREWAKSPTTSRLKRREAMRILKQYGFDDEALAQEALNL